MNWKLIVTAILTAVPLCGCQTLTEGIARSTMQDEIDALKEQPCEVAYRDLEDPGTFKAALYKGFGVDPDRYKESVKENADRNLTRNDTPARAFEEMVDELSQRLSSTIPSLPQVQASKNLKVLTVGHFANETGVQGGRISYVVESVADRLVKNQAVTNDFAIVGVESSRREDILTQIAGPNYDQVFQSADGSNFRDVKLKRFHPQDVYVLSGSVFRLPDYDGGVPRMTISTKVRIEHPRTGEIITAEEFKRNYIYHPVRQSWLSEAENDGLRAKAQQQPQTQTPPTQN